MANFPNTLDLAASPATAQPSDHGLIAWSFDPAHAITATGPAAGVLSLARVHLRSARTITNVHYAIGTAASGGTAGQNFVGIYDSTGARAGVSADQTANMGGTGLIAAALTATYAAAPGFYWVAILGNASSSTALLARAGAGATTAVSSAGLTAAGARFGSILSAQTSLPTSFTPGSITLATNGTFWVAVS